MDKLIKDCLNFLSDIKKILKKYEKNKIIFDMLLNIVLVKFKIRKTALIELNSLNNFNENKIKKYKKLLNEFVEKLSLIETYDYTSYRYFISTEQIDSPENDIEVGKLLGFSCYNHDFDNVNTERISYKIIEEKTQTNIYTEVCVKDKIDETIRVILKNKFNEKIKSWNEKISRINLPYKFVLQINVIEPEYKFLLPENYKDKKFVLNNIKTYKDILFNYFFDNSKFAKDEKLIINKFSGFISIMEDLENFKMLYDKEENRYPSEGYNKLVRKLEAKENEIINKF